MYNKYLKTIVTTIMLLSAMLLWLMLAYYVLSIEDVDVWRVAFIGVLAFLLTAIGVGQ